EGRVRPDDVAAERHAGRRNELRAADLLVPLTVQFRDDQFALLVEEEVLVAVSGQEGGGGVGVLRAGRGGVGRPQALAGLEVHGHERARLIDALNRFALDERGNVDGADALVARAAPYDLRAGLVSPQFDQGRSVVQAADEQVVADLDGRHDRHAVVRYERDGPVLLAGVGVEADDGGGVPDDQLFLAADVDEARAAVAGLLDVEGLPELLAGGGVETDDGAALAADDTVEALADDEGVAAKAPGRHL